MRRSSSLTFEMSFQERDATLRYCDIFGVSPCRMVHVYLQAPKSLQDPKSNIANWYIWII